MYPVILRIGDQPIITSFGLMMFLSFVSAAWITGAQLRRYGLPPRLAWDTACSVPQWYSKRPVDRQAASY
jgi:hypothetical protein